MIGASGDAAIAVMALLIGAVAMLAGLYWGTR